MKGASFQPRAITALPHTGSTHHQDTRTTVPKGKPLCNPQLHIRCHLILHFNKYPSLPIFLHTFPSPPAFSLLRVRSSSLQSPRRMLQENFNQATQIKSQAGEANHMPEQMQPASPLLLWLASSLLLREQMKDVAFVLSSPQSALSKQKKGAASHSSGIKLGKQVLLAFPP